MDLPILEVYDENRHKHYQNGGLVAKEGRWPVFWGGHDDGMPKKPELAELARRSNAYPELLEACKELASQLDRVINLNPAGMSETRFRRCRTAIGAAAAIAKAKP